MNKLTIRGIDHIGITVPDIEIATTFLCESLGAEVIYESLKHTDTPIAGPALESQANWFPGTRIVAIRMLRVETGPDIELFEMHASEQNPAARGSDFGMQHLAVYADDPKAATERFEKAGGKMRVQPTLIPIAIEAGPNNTYAYGQTPWGMLVEFINRPDRMKYEDMTSLRRWHDDGHKR